MSANVARYIKQLRSQGRAEAERRFAAINQLTQERRVTISYGSTNAPAQALQRAGSADYRSVLAGESDGRGAVVEDGNISQQTQQTTSAQRSVLEVSRTNLLEFAASAAARLAGDDSDAKHAVPIAVMGDYHAARLNEPRDPLFDVRPMLVPFGNPFRAAKMHIDEADAPEEAAATGRRKRSRSPLLHAKIARARENGSVLSPPPSPAMSETSMDETTLPASPLDSSVPSSIGAISDNVPSPSPSPAPVAIADEVMEENVMEMSVKAQPDTAAVADEELVSSDMQTAQRAYNISAGLRQALNKELRRPGKSMLLCLCRCVLDIVGNYYRLYLLMYS